MDRGLASPPSPYDDPTPCPECGAEDAEYGQHEPGCPSGYPTRDELRGDRAAELILTHVHHWVWKPTGSMLWARCECGESQYMGKVTEAELRAAWGDR